MQIWDWWCVKIILYKLYSALTFPDIFSLFFDKIKIPNENNILILEWIDFNLLCLVKLSLHIEWKQFWYNGAAFLIKLESEKMRNNGFTCKSYGLKDWKDWKDWKDLFSTGPLYCSFRVQSFYTNYVAHCSFPIFSNFFLQN